jgi:hypothetical protein
VGGQSNAYATEEADASGGEEGVMIMMRRESRAGSWKERKKGDVRSRASIFGPFIKPHHRFIS